MLLWKVVQEGFHLNHFQGLRKAANSLTAIAVVESMGSEVTTNLGAFDARMNNTVATVVATIPKPCNLIGRCNLLVLGKESH